MKIIENENDSFNISLTVVDTWQWREKLSTKQLGVFRDLSNWGTEGKTENFGKMENISDSFLIFIYYQ
jgi:hypothetical protein